MTNWSWNIAPDGDQYILLETFDFYTAATNARREYAESLVKDHREDDYGVSVRLTRLSPCKVWGLYLWRYRK